MQRRSGAIPKPRPRPARPTRAAQADDGPTKRQIVLALVAIGLLLVGGLTWYVTSRSGTPEDEVRYVIDAIEDAIERGDVGDVMENIHAEYASREAMMGSKRSLRKLLLGLLVLRRTKIRIQRLGGIEVEFLEDGRALARFQAAIAEGKGLQIDDAGRYDFEVTLRRAGPDHDGDWQVIAHKRTRP